MSYSRPRDRYGKPDERYPKNWQRLRNMVFDRDKRRCRVCGRKPKYLQCHHIVPVGRNGSHHSSNLISVCRRCHKMLHNLI